MPSSRPRPVSRAVSRAGSASPSAGSGGEVAVSGRSRGSGAKIATVARRAADQRAGGVGGELEDLLDGQRGVERHRGVGQRAQLLDVLVLDPRDLLHLAVAAVDALEDRQALAQEVGAGLQRRVRRADRRRRAPAGRRRGAPRRGRARSAARRRPGGRCRRPRPARARRGRRDRPRRRPHRRPPARGRRWSRPPSRGGSLFERRPELRLFVSDDALAGARRCRA